ncbi:MAG: inositol monophosphatase [SAR202 cluster bacterium]|nr:inositol monophosphatase [SAR202 cluster bacterium]
MASSIPASKSGRDAFAIAEEAARLAGALVARRFRETVGADAAGSLQVTRKGRNNLVTEVDQASERIILDIIRDEYPGFSILAEESGRTVGNELTWLVDPVDGTRNFASGIPHVAVNIALARGDDVLLGMTYDPLRDELFAARAGQGATLNGKRVAAAGESLAEAVLGFDMGYVDDKGKRLLELIHGLWPRMQTVRLMGSAALGLAWVAAGRLQIYAHHHVYPWDVAPGFLLIREAGGLATDTRGGPARFDHEHFIAGAPLVHAEFMAATAGMAWRSGGWARSRDG